MLPRDTVASPDIARDCSHDRQRDRRTLQRSCNGIAIRHTDTCARVPALTAREAAVIAVTDVLADARVPVEPWRDEAERRTLDRIDARNESRPQRRDRARAAD